MHLKYANFEDLFKRPSEWTNSWEWKNLRKAYEVYQKGIRRKIGNGKPNEFWLDN